MKSIELYSGGNVTYTLTASGSEAARLDQLSADVLSKISKLLRGESNPFEEQYPNSGYVVINSGDKLSVTCPDHGSFLISKANFLYLRGCNLCRGIHPRAYPLQSDRKCDGNPVYINADLTASLVSDNHVYAASVIDKRVAALLPAILTRLAQTYGLEFAKWALVEAAHFQVKPHHFESTKVLARKTVAIDADGNVYPPDVVCPENSLVTYYRKRLEAELVYYLIKCVPQGNLSAALALLNPTKV